MSKRLRHIGNALLYNVVPLFGVVFLDWRLGAIVLILWIEIAAMYLAAAVNTVIQKHPMGCMYVLGFPVLTMFVILSGGGAYAIISKAFGYGDSYPLFNSPLEAVITFIILGILFLLRHRRSLKDDKGEWVLGMGLYRLVVLHSLLMGLFFLAAMAGADLDDLNVTIGLIAFKLFFDLIVVEYNVLSYLKRRKK